MHIRYLIIFLLAISCSSQQSTNVVENYNEPIFTTSKWKKLFIEELKQQQLGEEKAELLEDIEFINSKDNSFLERIFLYSGFKNSKQKGKDSFFLVNYFYKGDGHYEYTYILQKTNKCNSYLITNNGIDQKRDLRRVNCDEKLDKFNSLMNSQNDKFTPVKGILILWSCVEGNNQIRIFNNLTIYRDNLIESIFY
ncbi:hypothetical protein [Chryseobacterium shandongense]|uniref:hypothetical protein n=1 Tax=Chryseobacterium shandongense TaxID=1493872 RepID=UPI000F5139F1|nr:hypothetical protein [Chryseobacterium shandongense]AZA56573.1 hypothetical protein EG350_05020 [Chryseobacterium shandongense]